MCGIDCLACAKLHNYYYYVTTVVLDIRTYVLVKSTALNFFTTTILLLHAHTSNTQ